MIEFNKMKNEEAEEMEVVTINNEKYTYIKNYKSSKKERDSFNELSGKVFELNFEEWYRGGYWQDQYIPYSLMHENKVVANVSVNIMDFKVFGEARRYIQIGTVMTDPDYRHRGLSKFLMEKVLNEWETQCDSIYLFANDSARKFYPQFGFEEAVENQYMQLVNKKDTEVVARRLDVNNAEDLGLLLKCYEQSNPFSALSMEKNVGLLMFYCSSFMKEDIYYIDAYDTVVIATFNEDNMILHDVFGGPKVSLKEIINSVARTSSKAVVLGFTPKNRAGYDSFLLEEEDSTLFIMKDKENIFNKHEVMFPTLSHA